MRHPAETDPAGVWQAWVAGGRDREERLRRYAAVPVALQARVASHMRTVQAIEQFNRRRTTSGTRTAKSWHAADARRAAATQDGE